MSRSDTERLGDIARCIDAIDRAQATVQRYPGDLDLAQIALDAVQHIARMRDLIGHHYDKLDPQIVRATIAEPVERPRAACEAILAESADADDDVDADDDMEKEPVPATHSLRACCSRRHLSTYPVRQSTGMRRSRPMRTDSVALASAGSAT